MTLTSLVAPTTPTFPVELTTAFLGVCPNKIILGVRPNQKLSGAGVIGIASPSKTKNDGQTSLLASEEGSD